MSDQRRKLWVGVGAFVLLGGPGVEATAGQIEPPRTASSPSVLLASAHAHEGGEREGGEGGEAHHHDDGGEAHGGGEGGEMHHQADGGGEAHAGGEGGEGGEAYLGGEGGEGGEAYLGGEGGEGGEGATGPLRVFAGGEGGEGGEGATIPSASESAGVYYSELAFMLGHLRTARALYEHGRPDLGRAHLAHPVAENLPALRHALRERGLEAVGERLRALAGAAHAGASWAAIADEYDAAWRAIERAMNDVAEARRTSPEFLADVLSVLLRKASHEYGEAIEDGRLVHAHAYRDSWGLARIGQRLLEHKAAVFRHADPATYRRLVEQHEAIMAAWPTIAPPDEPPLSVSQLYGRIAAFEFTASEF